jgi:hypothetical protein
LQQQLEQLLILHFSEMIEDLKKDFFKSECRKELIKMKLGILTSKLEIAKEMKIKVQNIKLQEDFMTTIQVKMEEMKTKKILEGPLKIIGNIEELQNSNDFLTYNSIQILRGKIESIKLSLSKSDESESHLECIICLSIPKCKRGSVAIYSCKQDHLLCSDCILRVNLCPSNYYSNI